MAKKETVSIPVAVARLLGEQPDPVILRYQLARTLWHLCEAGEYKGSPLPSGQSTLDFGAFAKHEATLIENGVLKLVPGVPEQSAYMLLGANVLDPRVLACGLDPFCYVSHLSAMEFHGLTDRMPEVLYLTSPSVTEWKSFAQEKMRKDLGDGWEQYSMANLPQLSRLTFEKILGRTIHRFASAHHGAYRVYREQQLRVATLGRTFLDMLREPMLCGGLSHVLQVYKEHAPTYFRLIADEIDQRGTSIDKVRAGYILETLCHLNDARIDAWVAHAVRGGSRKLDAAADYSPAFSERWCLSINTVLPA